MAVACTGVRARWGVHGNDRRDFLLEPGGRGFSVDRAEFDFAMREGARSAGAVWLDGWHVAEVARDDRGWMAATKRDGSSGRLTTRVLVDATGRAASVARGLGAHRVRLSCLIAAHIHWNDASASPAATVLDLTSVPGGWWYGLDVPGGYALAFHTDAQGIRRIAADRRARLTSMLDVTRALPERAAHAVRRGELTLADASTAALLTGAGDGWIAIGDAAASFDPLASQGIAHALASALAGAEAIQAFLAGDAGALAAYAEAVKRSWHYSVAGLAPIYAESRHAAADRFYLRQAAALSGCIRAV